MRLLVEYSGVREVYSGHLLGLRHRQVRRVVRRRVALLHSQLQGAPSVYRLLSCRSVATHVAKLRVEKLRFEDRELRVVVAPCYLLLLLLLLGALDQ